MTENNKQTRRTDSAFYDPVQSSRFVEMEGKWFFLVRESGLKGPFSTQEHAENALEKFLVESAAEVSNTASNFKTKLPTYSVEELTGSSSQRRNT